MVTCNPRTMQVDVIGLNSETFCLILTKKYPSPYEGCCGEYSILLSLLNSTKMYEEELKGIQTYFEKRNVSYGVNSKFVWCNIEYDDTSYRFCASNFVDLFTMIADEFHDSDESYDGEHGIYKTWNNIPGLDEYFDGGTVII